LSAEGRLKRLAILRIAYADTLVVRRYAVDGLDTFGQPLDEDMASVTITRRHCLRRGG
jgi:hypothetical protein